MINFSINHFFGNCYDFFHYFCFGIGFSFQFRFNIFRAVVETCCHYWQHKIQSRNEIIEFTALQSCFYKKLASLRIEDLWSLSGSDICKTFMFNIYKNCPKRIVGKMYREKAIFTTVLILVTKCYISGLLYYFYFIISQRMDCRKNGRQQQTDLIASASSFLEFSFSF